MPTPVVSKGEVMAEKREMDGPNLRTTMTRLKSGF
jgi:hypothetical protein